MGASPTRIINLTRKGTNDEWPMKPCFISDNEPSPLCFQMLRVLFCKGAIGPLILNGWYINQCRRVATFVRPSFPTVFFTRETQFLQGNAQPHWWFRRRMMRAPSSLHKLENGCWATPKTKGGIRRKQDSRSLPIREGPLDHHVFLPQTHLTGEQVFRGDFHGACNFLPPAAGGLIAGWLITTRQSSARHHAVDGGREVGVAYPGLARYPKSLDQRNGACGKQLRMELAILTPQIQIKCDSITILKHKYVKRNPPKSLWLGAKQLSIVVYFNVLAPQDPIGKFTLLGHIRPSND